VCLCVFASKQICQKTEQHPGESEANRRGKKKVREKKKLTRGLELERDEVKKGMMIEAEGIIPE